MYNGTYIIIEPENEASNNRQISYSSVNKFPRLFSQVWGRSGYEATYICSLVRTCNIRMSNSAFRAKKYLCFSASKVLIL